MSRDQRGRVSFSPTSTTHMGKLPHQTLNTRRHAYTYDEVEEEYYFLDEDKREIYHKTLSLFNIFPVLASIKRYNWHNNALGDFLSGVSVAFLHLPQGLAYGLLASLTPISGLYTSFFAVAVYTVFGTCPQISMGTNSVLSLITAAMVEREELVKFGPAVEKSNDLTVQMNSTPNDPGAATSVDVDYQLAAEEEQVRLDYKLKVAMTASCVCGIILFFMGVFRMGFITSYMPSSFVGGFTTGAALHIATSQVKHIFRIKVPTRAGAGKLLLTYKDIALELHNTNIYDTIICISSIFILLLFSTYINPKINAKIGLDMPMNLILVLVGIALSYYSNFHEDFGVAIVGNVPTGFATPRLPRFEILSNIVNDCIVLSVITFAMTISMAMLMAKLHTYELDSNKELMAYGICNVVTSFFPSQACSASPARTMILSNTGAKTNLSSIPTVIFLLLVILFAGKLIRPLPVPILAAMILVAVKDLMMQVTHVPGIWAVSKSDALVWVGTCLVTSVVDLQYGVIVGILIAVFGIIVNNQLIQGTLIGISVSEDLYIQGENRAGVTSPQKTRIFYFPSQLFFANAELFKAQLFQKVFDPTIVNDMDYELSDMDGSESSSQVAMSLHNADLIHCIILDCSAMTYIDFDGVSMLKMVVIRYNKAGVQMLLARCPKSTMETLERAKFFQILPRNCVYHDIDDAMRKKDDVRLGISRLSVIGPSFSISILPPKQPADRGFTELDTDSTDTSVI